MRTIILAALAAVLAGTRPALANRWGADYFPNVPLITQDGKEVRLYDDLLKGKSVAINVIYTSCTDECPLETARLVQLQKLMGQRMGKDVFFYSITIDPKRDTPQVLKAYAEKFGVGPGWLFLTGKPEDIKLATKKLGLSRNADSVSKDGHSASLMIGREPTGQWMRNSAVDNPQFLADMMSGFFGWRVADRQKSYAEARPVDVSKGQYLFESRCSACHTVGEGERIGPDLLAVTSRRERAWLVRYVVSPDRMLADKDPVAVALFEKYKGARMPNVGLGPTDVTDIVTYLEKRSAAHAGPGKTHDHSAHAH
jgi:protein SCO1